MQLSFEADRKKQKLQTKIHLYCYLYLPIYLSLLMLFNSLCESSYCLVSFKSAWRTPFIIPYSIAINSLSFCFLKISYFLIYFLKESFVGYEILVWESFSFSTLNMLSHHFLTSIKVSDEKSAINLIADTLVVMSLLFFLLLLRFSLSFYSMPMIDVDVYLWVYPSWNLLNIFSVLINVFHQIQEVFSHYFSSILYVFFSLSSPSGTPIICTLV